MVSFNSSQLLSRHQLAQKINSVVEIAQQRNSEEEDERGFSEFNCDDTDHRSELLAASLMFIVASVYPRLSLDIVKAGLNHTLLLVGAEIGLADASAASNSSDQKDSSKKSSGGSTWLEVLLICLGLVAVGAFSVFLFKLWQRKKREEQHARLLRLFEQDDELEVELGIRD
ncbi:hypothetical protein SASPL_103530 [Salvia splendens]|uniref:Uncharacterized protein n=1 Tax=Salvia splendens TaxID=180675 RepID=A0A8X8YLT9_SALSN|nr:hypothetical protein SASPL_103530 [Salvia splendens]